MKTEKTSLEGQDIVRAIVELAEERKAEKIVTINVDDASSVTSTLIICQAGNTAHTRAIADNIMRGTKDRGIRPWLTEGVEEGRWVLVDYFDVCVHILLPELREYYDLESLWTKELRNRKSIESARPKQQS